MQLYSYFRSSAAYRVRIALNLKGLDYGQVPVNLVRAEQKAEDYTALNPQGLVPALALDSGEVLAQSLAIMEWAEETHPQPPLLPQDPLPRARVRAVVGHIACDVHPILNSSVLAYLRERLDADAAQVSEWYAHWVARAFGAVEQLLQHSAGRCAFGDEPGMADCLLVPQLYNARRFDVPVEPYPTIVRVCDYLDTLPAFEAAHPSRQPDAAA